jgi:HSP20 family protein
MTLPVLWNSGPLGRWDPYRELADVQARFDQLVQSAFQPLGRPDGWRPLADVSETDEAYVLEVELPGVKRDDVSVEVTDDVLSISGEYKEKEKTGWFRSRVRRSGQFQYRTLLPANVDADKISAELAEGVLKVTVPKTESTKPRRIEITAR